MTDTTPAAIEALLKDVTPGPWVYRPDKYSDWGTVYAGGCHLLQARHPERLSAEILDEYRAAKIDPWESNARFIAAARDLVPALAAEAAALRDEVARLRKVETWQIKMRADAMTRRHMNAPEDQHVAALCERHGYGAVIDAASRLWARKDCMGAFYVGGCIGFRSEDEARDAITAEPLGHGVTADDFGGEA